MRHSVITSSLAALMLTLAYIPTVAHAERVSWPVTAADVNVDAPDSASGPAPAPVVEKFAVTGVISVHGTKTARGQYRKSFDSKDACEAALKDGTDDAMAAANAHLVAVVAAKLGPDAKVDFTCEVED